jgi:hypothetical protein
MCSIGWPIPRSVASDRTPSNSARFVPPLFPWCPTCCRRELLLTPRRPAALDRANWCGTIGNVTSESFHGWSPIGSWIGSDTDVLHPGRRAGVRSRVASNRAWAPTRARYTFRGRSNSSEIGCTARARPLGTHRRDCSLLRHGLLPDAELAPYPRRLMPAKT